MISRTRRYRFFPAGLRVGPVLILCLSVLTLSGCAAALSAVGTGVLMGAEYVMDSPVAKSITCEANRMKKAALIALCKMKITVREVRQIEEGEEILASAPKLQIKIELKRITSKVTQIRVTAEKGFLRWDKETAEEILQQTKKVAETLVT